MTLSVAWIRKQRNVEELVFATDSRLTGGRAWDACPKILILPRRDSAICFAGDTDDAYPLMIQAMNSVQMHPPALTRAMDLFDLRGHLVRVFNHMQEQIHTLPKGQMHPPSPQAVFLLGGYSWRRQAFQIWKLYYSAQLARFTYEPAKPWKGGVLFVGDHVDQARVSLVELLRSKGSLLQGGLDMEPFEVLRDMVRSTEYPSIGGPPQLVKVYRHLNSVPFGVRWTGASGAVVAVNGRPFLPYEATILPVIDPDSLQITQGSEALIKQPNAESVEL